MTPSDTPVTVESLSDECEQLAEAAAWIAGRSMPPSLSDIREVARLIAATNLNLSKLCKGMGQ